MNSVFKPTRWVARTDESGYDLFHHGSLLSAGNQRKTLEEIEEYFEGRNKS